MVNAGAFKCSIVCHDSCFLTTGINIQALARDLPAIHIHHECTKTEMLKFVGVRIDSAEKVIVCYHSEQESFVYAAHDSLIDQE